MQGKGEKLSRAVQACIRLCNSKVLSAKDLI